MKANQQKNCTRPTFQNVEGALRSSVNQSARSSSFSFTSSDAPLYSAYSLGFHSFTLAVVYMTHSIRIAAPT